MLKKPPLQSKARTSKVARALARAPKTLHDMERVYSQLFENAPEAMALLAADETVLRVNSHFTKLFEYSLAEATGRLIADLVVPKELNEETQLFTERLGKRETVSADSLRRTKTGRLIPVSVLATSFQTLTGETAVYVAYRDITLQVRAAETLEKAKKRFQSLIENASDMISIHSVEGKTIYVSPSVARTLGFSESYLLAEKPFDMIHPDDRSSAIEVFNWLLTHPGETKLMVCRRKRHDGQWRLMSALGKNLVDDAGVGGIVFNSKDVTDETELGEQLRRAQKMEAIGRLAGGIAHDFNNLLTVIGMFTEFILADSALSEEHRADLTEVKKAADRAAALTRQLLAFGRSQVLKPSTLNLGRRLEDLMPVLQRLLDATIEIKLQTDPNLWSVCADAGQIDQVLLNLALNARDAMPNGGALTFAAENCAIETEQRGIDEGYTTKAGEYVVLRVRDTGIGMDAATQRNIFEPFFTTKGIGKGTGLGLATAYGIVKQSGGYIKVRSAPQEGTEFAIYLPRGAGAPETGTPAEHPPEPEEGRLLVVEDEPAVSAALTRMLRAVGYVVTTARNGGEAWELFLAQKGDFDLLLTDLVMPELGGKELAEKCCVVNPALKVLFVSGYTQDSIFSQRTFHKGTQFLSKPFSRDTILSKIATVLAIR
jgi:PAS domain S-box-containing protein